MSEKQKEDSAFLNRPEGKHLVTPSLIPISLQALSQPIHSHTIRATPASTKSTDHITAHRAPVSHYSSPQHNIAQNETISPSWFKSDYYSVSDEGNILFLSVGIRTIMAHTHTNTPVHCRLAKTLDF